MPATISSKELTSLLNSKSQFALIDVREVGEYNSTHIPDSSLIPRRQLERQMSQSVPFKGVPVIVCDDDGRRAALAASTLERMGYKEVKHLEGGINLWSSLGYPTEWGSNVPSKDFGEKMEVEHHVPEISASDLHSRIEQGAKLAILDTRTPEEYRRFCIPGGRSVPGGELALRITDIASQMDTDSTIIVNCAGRTRSIIGTRMLQRMGFSNVYGLENGTSGWVLAGYELESGADRVEMPEPSPEALARAEAYAARLASEDGVRYLDIQGLQARLADRDSENIYLVDVRTKEEYEQGHIADSVWFPGGQAVQRSDDVAVVKNSTIIFVCDRVARATFAASWYRQMGVLEVYAVDGGIGAWAAAGLPLESGPGVQQLSGLAEAQSRTTAISPQQLHSSLPSTVLFVDTSQDFARGHVAGSVWAPRGWLELHIGGIAPDNAALLCVTCLDGENSTLAGATLRELGYTQVSVLQRGMAAWMGAGLPVEKGLSGVMSTPSDVVAAGPDRNFADMMNYLRWETALGEKYVPSAG